ncbi:MAG: PAS domain S-box protein [bacterium]
MFARFKTFLIILGIIGALLIAVYELAARAIVHTAVDNERKLAQNELHMVLNELDDQLDRLRVLTKEWSARDDARRYAQDPDDSSFILPFEPGRFDRLEIDFAAIADSSGTIPIGMAYSADESGGSDFHAALGHALIPGGALLRPEPTTGLLRVDGDLALVASHPIAAEDGKAGEAILIMGRFLGTNLTHKIASITRLDFALYDLDDPSLPKKLKNVSTVLPGQPSHFETRSDTVIAFMPLLDLAGRPVKMIGIQIPRTLYTESIGILQYLMGFLISFALLAGIVVLGLVEKTAFQQRRIEESEMLFRTFFEIAPSGLAIQDPEGRYLRVNATLAEMLGYSADKVRGKTWKDITHPDDVESTQARMREMTACVLDSVTFIKRYIRRDGNALWCQVSVAALRKPTGAVDFFIATMEDITELKKAEMQEQAMADLLRAVVAAADELIRCPDVDALYRRAVELARQKLGIERCGIYIEEGCEIRGTYGTDLQGETTDERTYRAQRDARWAARLRPPKPGDPSWMIVREPLREWSGRRVNLMEDGWTAITPIHSSHSPIGAFYNDTAISRKPVNTTTQEVIAIYASLLGNIIDRKRAEDGLRRMGMAVQQAAESITITDTQGTIEYINPAFTQITGYTTDEAIGRNARILKSGKQDKEFYERLWTALTRGEVWTGHFTNRRKDGTLYDAYQTVSAIRDASGRIVNYVSVSRDVTREMDLEAQFIQAQKMEGIGRLAGGIAHDFNNLLTAILGNSKIIREGAGKDSPIREEVDEIIRAGERAAKLTRQLLAFARKQLVHLRPIRINEIINEMGKFLSRTLGEHIEVRLQLSETLGNVNADPGLIEQLLINLAVNARDAMPKGGVLEVRTVTVDLDQPLHRTRGEFKPGRHVMLAVRDTGSGMTDDVAQHVFEPFFTTKEVGKGTGLGLATVYGIVEQCKGHIEFSTKVGAGTEFRIFLPQVAEGEIAGADAPSAPMAREGETILLVEDEDPVRNLTVRILESLGYKVIAARHGREALEIYQHMGDKIDLVVTDVVMPQMGGPDLVANLRRFSSFHAALYTSGFTAGTLLDHGLMDQEWMLLLKPYTREELAVRVRETLDKFPRRPV